MVTVFPTRHHTKNNEIMRTVTEESLRRRLARLESALESEKARLRKYAAASLGSRDEAYQMYPSFRREDELIGKIKAVRQQLSQMSAGGDNHTFKETGR